MALVSTVRSDVTYHVQIAVCGTWSALGVLSGIGRIAGGSWAVRLQVILCWVAFAVYAVAGIAMLVYAIGLAGGYRPSTATREFTLADFALVVGLAAGVFATGVPFLVYARRRQRELSGQ